MALAVVILVGEPEQIRAGRGETAITLTQASARLGVSETTVYTLIAQGALAPCGVKLGKAKLFKEVDVERVRLQREE